MTRRAKSSVAVALGLMLSMSAVGAQTVITPPNNKYSAAEDVQLGREAASEVEKQLPMLRDAPIATYVETIGRRLAVAIPAELRHTEFRYTFQVVNVREINAFALPGGPMYLNRGMIAAAQTEAEMAGVMAHELSHVALRHGTAQATKATKYELGTLLGAVVGSIIGGQVGGAVAQSTQFGLGTAFLRFGREFEQQADLLGARIMADAGYDPIAMATMFKTIEAQGGAGGPQWLSSHPNPGARSEYITREAALLTVRDPVRDTREFTTVQTRLARMPPAPTTEAATRDATARGSSTPPPPAAPAPPAKAIVVAAPSARYTAYDEGGLFRVRVPSNWRELARNNVVTFAPDGAFAGTDGAEGFSHGMEMGIVRNERHDLRTATGELLASFARANPNLRQPAGYVRSPISGRAGLRVALTNVSDATGQQERIAVFTTLLRDGTLFYAFGVAPRAGYQAYDDAFRRVVSSITIAD